MATAPEAVVNAGRPRQPTLCTHDGGCNRFARVRAWPRAHACLHTIMPCHACRDLGYHRRHPTHHRAARRSMSGSEPLGSHALRSLTYCNPVSKPCCSPLLQIIIALERQTCRKPLYLRSPHRRSPSPFPTSSLPYHCRSPLTVALATTALVSSALALASTDEKRDRHQQNTPYARFHERNLSHGSRLGCNRFARVRAWPRAHACLHTINFPV